jgi:hypothetical protein
VQRPEVQTSLDEDTLHRVLCKALRAMHTLDMSVWTQSCARGVRFGGFVSWSLNWGLLRRASSRTGQRLQLSRGYYELAPLTEPLRRRLRGLLSVQPVALACQLRPCRSRLPTMLARGGGCSNLLSCVCVAPRPRTCADWKEAVELLAPQFRNTFLDGDGMGYAGLWLIRSFLVSLAG